MTDLLATAREQLASGSSHSVRRACWLARAALEARVADLLTARGIDASNASERGRMSCLEGAYSDDRDLTARAEYAWNRLSESCHQHAYQLAPTHLEASRLVDLVETLAPTKSSPGGLGPER